MVSIACRPGRKACRWLFLPSRFPDTPLARCFGAEVRTSHRSNHADHSGKGACRDGPGRDRDMGESQNPCQRSGWPLPTPDGFPPCRPTTCRYRHHPASAGQASWTRSLCKSGKRPERYRAVTANQCFPLHMQGPVRNHFGANNGAKERMLNGAQSRESTGVPEVVAVRFLAGTKLYRQQKLLLSISHRLFSCIQSTYGPLSTSTEDQRDTVWACKVLQSVFTTTRSTPQHQYLAHSVLPF